MKPGADSYNFLGGVAPPARGSITQHVTDALREAIVSLALRPGEVLDKGLICERLGVSRFPVSEAMARLATEGLVDIQPQRGTSVSHIRIADVLEFMLIRKALEAEAVRVVAGARTPEFLAALGDNLSQQRALAAADDQPGFHQADLAFHDLIFAAMRFSRMKAAIDATRANLDRARRLILTPRRLSATLGEHETIFAALAEGQGASAAAAMRAHIDSVMAELIAFARDHADVFADGNRLRDDPDYASFPFG